MAKRPFLNKLNDLDPKSWLKFQKSWFIHNPPSRRKDVLRHPAKFPETLVQEFIEFFTKTGETVLDPMAGTGSALVAALRAGRNGYGIELNPSYVDIARQVLCEERSLLGEAEEQVTTEIFQGDARQAFSILHQASVAQVDYVITSPPYWDMLHARGAQSQRNRRANTQLDVVYSEDPGDIGNIHNYELFIETLVAIYMGLQPCIKPGGYLTIIVKNVKKGGKVYPLAWDLAAQLSKCYILKDEKIWCQDDIRLAPYGLGNAWVSNTFHHYCLQFRNS